MDRIVVIMVGTVGFRFISNGPVRRVLLHSGRVVLRLVTPLALRGCSLAAGGDTAEAADPTPIEFVPGKIIHVSSAMFQA